MSFGGSVSAMIASIKANQLRKRRPFDKKVEVKGQQINNEFLRNASPDDLTRVRQVMAQQHERARRDRLIAVGAVLFIVAVLILWMSQQRFLSGWRQWP